MKTTRALWIVGLSLIVVSLGGCAGTRAVIDFIFGVTEDPATGKIITDGGGSILGTIAGAFGGPVGTGAVGLLTTLWAAIRGRQYKKVAKTGIKSIAKFRAAVKAGPLTEEKMLDILKVDQDRAGIRDRVRLMAKKAEADLEKEVP
jgi:hypothetical protein